MKLSLKKQAITKTIRTGRAVQSDIARAKIRKGEAGHTRIAVVVPKAVFKKAVDRNRAKRIFVEALRALEGRGGAIDMDIVVFPKQACAGKSSKDASRFLERIMAV